MEESYPGSASEPRATWASPQFGEGWPSHKGRNEEPTIMRQTAYTQHLNAQSTGRGDLRSPQRPKALPAPSPKAQGPAAMPSSLELILDDRISRGMIVVVSEPIGDGGERITLGNVLP